MQEALWNMALPKVGKSLNNDAESFSQISWHVGAHLTFQNTATVTMLLNPSASLDDH